MPRLCDIITEEIVRNSETLITLTSQVYYFGFFIIIIEFAKHRKLKQFLEVYKFSSLYFF